MCVDMTMLSTAGKIAVAAVLLACTGACRGEPAINPLCGPPRAWAGLNTKDRVATRAALDRDIATLGKRVGLHDPRVERVPVAGRPSPDRVALVAVLHGSNGDRTVGVHYSTAGRYALGDLEGLVPAYPGRVSAKLEVGTALFEPFAFQFVVSRDGEARTVELVDPSMGGRQVEITQFCASVAVLARGRAAETVDHPLELRVTARSGRVEVVQLEPGPVE
jgi:hypothetical protein